MVVLKPHRMFKIAVLAFLSCMVIYIWTVSQRSEGKCLCDDTHHSGSPQEERQLAISDSEAGLFMEGFENPSYGRLLRYIREIWIVPPPTRQTFQKSSWGKERHFSQVGQSEFVDNALGKRRGGFFVECGAGTGVALSNTLFFERYRNWTGLLIEANPKSYKQLLEKHRNAFTSNVCLSPTNKTGRLTLISNNDLSGLTDTMQEGHRRWIEKKMGRKQVVKKVVQCFPFYSMLLAMGRTHVDYLSLDVEGAELAILRTIPFDKVTIDILTIEYLVHGDTMATAKKLNETREFFRETGSYREVGTIKPLDVVFQRV